MAANAYGRRGRRSPFPRAVRGGVGESAQSEICSGEPGRVVEGAGDAEVGEVGAAVADAVGLSDQDVGRFDITVQQAAVMDVVKGIRDSGRDGGGLVTGIPPG